MAPPVLPSASTNPRKKKSFCNKHCIVASAGAITGILIFSWLSILLVFYTTRFTDLNPRVITPSPSELATPISLSSFSSIFRPLRQVSSYIFPSEFSLLEFGKHHAEPAIIPATVTSDWHKLFLWASNNQWLTNNDLQYDFQAQQRPIYFKHIADKPFETLVPLPDVAEDRIEFITLAQFFEQESEAIHDHQRKHTFKNFEGFVFRPIDKVWLAPESLMCLFSLANSCICLSSIYFAAQGVPQFTTTDTIQRRFERSKDSDVSAIWWYSSCTHLNHSW